MSKILISPLGAGALKKDSIESIGRYRKATYKIAGEEYETSFVASALYKHLELDDIIFIGTVKSMWEEVYFSFCSEKGIMIDEDYWEELSKKVDRLDRNSDLSDIDLKPLEKILGANSHCILIHYGLDEAELWQNFDNIFKIVNHLQRGDELYIDITHSFRSLSMFLFLVLMFINNLYGKDIKVAGIYYGMLDVSRELGYAPIVNLGSLFELTDWIKGAYSLKNYGNGYLIADLLEAKGQKNIALQVRSFSHIINLNYLTAIKQEIITLATSLNKKSFGSPFKHVQYILEKFVQRFARCKTDSDFQVELAGWYFENKRYATGYIILQESIITYLCEMFGRHTISKVDRDEMKAVIHQTENKRTPLAKCYFHINAIRKNIAHALGERAKYFNEDAITASKYQAVVKNIFNKKNWGEDYHLTKLYNIEKIYYKKINFRINYR